MYPFNSDVSWADADKSGPSKTSSRSFWTDERIAQLRVLTAENRSAAQIGKIMGVSRNGVIGKWHRLKMTVRRTRPDKAADDSQIQKIKRRRSEQTVMRRLASPSIAQHEPMIDPVSEPLRISLIDLQDQHCRWPLDDKDQDGLALFCGHPSIGDCPYCAAHARIAYAPASRDGRTIWRAYNNRRAA